MQVGYGDRRFLPRGERDRSKRRELLGADRDDHVWQEFCEPRLERYSARCTQPRAVHGRREECGHFLECSVLQKSGEEEVSCFEESKILLVLNLPAGKQTRCFEVQQGCRDQEETARLVEIPGWPLILDVCDEIVSDLVECELGYFKFVLGDQRQQEIKGTLETTDANRKTPGSFGLQGIWWRAQRAKTSRAKSL